MKKFLFIKNAILLTGTAFLLRTIGIFFRIYISNKISAEGMGLYQLIFSVYILATTFATSGISVAVMRIVSEDLPYVGKKAISSTLGKAIFISVILGVGALFALYFSADFIGKHWICDPRGSASLKILSLCLPAMSVTGCLRGYFVARRKVSSITMSQIFEQVVRIFIVVYLLDRYLPLGLEAACKAIVIGSSVSEIASCIWLYISFGRDKKKLPLSPSLSYPHNMKRKSVTSRFVGIALPVAFSTYLNSILRTIENLMVPGNLTKFNGSKETSLEEFGMLKGMVMPILFFPSSFLTALSTLLVPEIAEAHARRQTHKMQETISRSIYITLALSFLISGCFVLLYRELGIAIYHSEAVGFFICALGPIMPFIYLESICHGILQGLNQQVSSLKYSLFDSGLRIILIAVLVPYYGIRGFIFVMIISNILTCFLNVHRLFKVTRLPFRLVKWIIVPLFCITVAGLGVLNFKSFCLPENLSCIWIVCSCIPLTCFLYGLCMLVCGGIKLSHLKILKAKK